VGLGAGAVLAAASGNNSEAVGGRNGAAPDDARLGSVEHHEAEVRNRQVECALSALFRTLWSAILVFIFFLISFETLMSCALSVGFTYIAIEQNEDNESWQGGSMDWVVIGFAVVTPLTVSITMAYRRREQALYEVSRIRSLCFQIYLCHSVWDWKAGTGREGAPLDRNGWLKHTDEVLEQLICIGDELTRFLTLPTSSRSYHRMMPGGRRKAADIVEVSYRLFDSLYTQRMIALTRLTEKLKSLGLNASEASRIRQYERFIGEGIEMLRMVKMYRTPQALRSFGRIFTLILPPFYAPSFAQLAIDQESLAMGIIFAVVTPLILNALFQSMQAIEDPFVGWVSLDGIDVKEELEILHYHQLISARATIFPNAAPFQKESLPAIVAREPVPFDASVMSLDVTERKSLVGRMSLVGRNGRKSLDATERKSTDGRNSMDGSHRLSHFNFPNEAMDGSSRMRVEASMDGSTRTSHFARDSSRR